MTVKVITRSAWITLPTISGAANTAAQFLPLLSSNGSASGGILSFAAAAAPITTATLSSTLSPSSGTITALPVTGTPTVTAGKTLLIVWGGHIQAFIASGTNGAGSLGISSATPNFAYPSGTSLADSLALPYLQFPLPTQLPPQVSGMPGLRFIIHNWSQFTPVQPWTLNSDGSLFASGGNLCLAEPGQLLTLGSSSYGTLNQTVPGVPTASMRIAFQSLVTGDAAGFKIATLVWMV